MVTLMIIIVLIVGAILLSLNIKEIGNGTSDYEIWKEQDKANYPELYKED